MHNLYIIYLFSISAYDFIWLETTLLLGIQTSLFFCICYNHMVDAGVYTSFPAGSEQDIWHIYQLMRCLNGVPTPPITSAANVQTQSLCSFYYIL